MERPTADDCYARAKSALENADRAASNDRSGVAEVQNHLVVAAGWQALAESLADRERPRRGTARADLNEGLVQ